MIKIIKEGKITRFKKTCPDCGCEFEYETSDLIPDYSVCLTTFPSQYSTYVICPCCGKHIRHGVISVANPMSKVEINGTKVSKKIFDDFLKAGNK